MLGDTTFRDKTQVVSRWFRRSGREPSDDSSDIFEPQPPPHNILMVDQVWLWVLRRPDLPDTLITSFPNRQGSSPAAFDDLQKHIFDDQNRDPIFSTGDLVGQILAVCFGTLSPSQDKDSLKFLQFFENSIANLVSVPKHTPDTASRF
jgi:hypothetical protein